MSELVAAPRKLVVPCDYVDYCEESIQVLNQRLAGLPNIQAGHRKVGDARKLPVAGKTYDMVVNMHGLYGINSGQDLEDAIDSMYNALKPGGRMVLSIGASDTIYHEANEILLQAGMVDRQLSRGKDIAGILVKYPSFTREQLVYHENVEDKESLHHYLFTECLDNCYSTVDTERKTEQGKQLAALSPYLNGLVDQREDGTLQFEQKTDVFIVTKPN